MVTVVCSCVVPIDWIMQHPPMSLINKYHPDKRKLQILDRESENTNTVNEMFCLCCVLLHAA